MMEIKFNNPFKKATNNIKPLESYMDGGAVNWLKVVSNKIGNSKKFFWFSASSMFLAVVLYFFTENLYLVFVGFVIGMFGVQAMQKKDGSSLAVLGGFFLVLICYLGGVGIAVRILFYNLPV